MGNHIVKVTVFLIAVLVLASASMSTVLGADQTIDFQQHIRPILVEHCFKCHGPDEGTRQSDLRLDLREMATAKRNSGELAIVPGNPDASWVLMRVTSDDPDLVMPPPNENNALTSAQISMLRQWIQAGAKYSPHWAFVPPRQTDLLDLREDPTTGQLVDAAKPISHPIDGMVAHRLKKAGVAMSPPAPHDVLCRRIHLDVIGLPPSPSEVTQFVAVAEQDPASAVAALVERLLHSAHYGEKWARHWLDVARYADTNGYEKDLPREQWAWRDWVIQVINADLPYNQFIIEQIAGDLLPNRTQNQLIATGFLRNGMINEEGAIVFEQFRMEGLFDRMDCIGKAVLGISIQCAQCHNHKYDPISQNEYYGMFAFLNDTCESKSWVYTQQQQKQIVEITAEIGHLENQCREHNPDYQQQIADWERSQLAAAPQWEILDTTEQVWVGGVNHPEEKADHSVMVMGHPTTEGTMYVVAEPQLDGITGLRLEALTHGDLPFGGPGQSYRGTFALSELTVEVKPSGSDSWKKLTLNHASSDFAEEDQPLVLEDSTPDEKRRIGPIAFLIDENIETGWRADRGPLIRNTESVAVVQFAEPLQLPTRTLFRVTLDLKHSPGKQGVQNTMLGRMRFALTRSLNPRAANYDHAATLAMQKPPAHRRATETAAVFRAWRKSVPELSAMNQQIAACQQQYPEAHTSVLTVTARDPTDRRNTFLLDRGVWDKPKQRIRPHVPALFHPLHLGEADHSEDGLCGPASATSTALAPRLAFARWLVDPNSPFAARVQVNRVWQAIFGKGLVETPEDFGLRAPQPEYLNVLDWLAVDFVAGDWSTKHLIRTILFSATYQQSSQINPEILRLDPQNSWLARSPRFRAEAEVIRDIALSVSGLLNRKIGGASILPPVPDNVLNDTFTRPDWTVATGVERYRRALYVFRKRSMPDPVLMNFDAPNADFSCARRIRSNTPLAALVALNEPVFVEAARAMALRILREGGTTDQERTAYAFRLCTARSVKPAEQAEVLALLKDCRTRLAEGSLSINEVATGNLDRPLELPTGCSPQDAAAWTIAARVLLNLDETLSKN